MSDEYMSGRTDPPDSVVRAGSQSVRKVNEGYKEGSGQWGNGLLEGRKGSKMERRKID
jgi:hypothetical protein